MSQPHQQPDPSPEQIRELPLDERTDIFSLGMTAWFLLRGSGPVEQRFMEKATLADYGIRVKPVAGGTQLSVETASMVATDPGAQGLGAGRVPLVDEARSEIFIALVLRLSA